MICARQRQLFPIVYGDEFYESLFQAESYSLVAVSTEDGKVRHCETEHSWS